MTKDALQAHTKEYVSSVPEEEDEEEQASTTFNPS